MRILALLALLASSPALAATSTPSFSNLTSSDFSQIARELSANFTYSSLNPASSLGGLWGFEIGVVGGVTRTPEILNVVKRNNSSFKEKQFPHAGALARLGLPYGLTVEALVIPKIKVSELELSQYGGALQWTFTDVMDSFPLSLAVKGFYTKTKLGFSQSIYSSALGQNINGTVDFDDGILGAQFLASKRLAVFEPYVGVGYSKASAELGITSADPNASVFLSGASRESAKPTSVTLLAGLDVRLFFFALGAEYQKAFRTQSVSGRVSFRF